MSPIDNKIECCIPYTALEILTTELCYNDSVFLRLFLGRKAIKHKG